VTYKRAIIKRRLEAIFIYPFVLLGKLLSPFFALKTRYGVFVFSPSADIGGSVKVNYDLCCCLADQVPLVIFSKKPKNNDFLEKFTSAGIATIDLHRYVDNKWVHFINILYRGIVASWINSAENPVIIGGESLFFYKVLPHIKKRATRADICHLNTWFDYTQQFLPDLDVRVFSTAKLKRDAEALYRQNALPADWYSRLHFIDNKVTIPPLFEAKNPSLEIVFIGRGAPQKRVPIIAAMAKKMFDRKANVHFSFVGDVEKVLMTEEYPFATFYGNVRDSEAMEAIYNNSDVLLLTSAYEGLPIAVMEMMAHGKVVVSTAVDGIPDYIENGVNGFLLTNHADENKIMEDGVHVLQILADDASLLHEVGNNSRRYAEQHFSGATFCEKYKKVLLFKKY